MIAYLQSEPGADVVEEALLDSESARYIHAVNFCEVYYDAVRRQGETVAAAMVQDLLGAGLVIRMDLDLEFWQSAGLLKAQQRRVSLADCFCITLTRRLGGEILTCDHHEFDRVAPLGLCPVRFAR